MPERPMGCGRVSVHLAFDYRPAMTYGLAWDATGTALVRKGRTVSKGGRFGTVVKANGPSCWIRWQGDLYGTPERTADVTVVDLRVSDER